MGHRQYSYKTLECQFMNSVYFDLMFVLKAAHSLEGKLLT